MNMLRKTKGMRTIPSAAPAQKRRQKVLNSLRSCLTFLFFIQPATYYEARPRRRLPQRRRAAIMRPSAGAVQRFRGERRILRAAKPCRALAGWHRHLLLKGRPAASELLHTWPSFYFCSSSASAAEIRLTFRVSGSREYPLLPVILDQKLATFGLRLDHDAVVHIQLRKGNR